jgi:hypothetical protein
MLLLGWLNPRFAAKPAEKKVEEDQKEKPPWGNEPLKSLGNAVTLSIAWCCA